MLHTRAPAVQPVCGVESNAAAASAFCANLPGVPDPEATLERFLERVKRREPGVPGKEKRCLEHGSCFSHFPCVCFNL
jgi:hypothetical protein